ncbi:type I-F CRISPR-associated protein Csy2, partial [Xanthomonas fragariae]
MSRCPAFSHLLVLPHLHVHNANAVSSPLTHGFP